MIGADVDREAAQQFALLSWDLTTNGRIPVSEFFGWNMTYPLEHWENIYIENSSVIAISLDSYELGLDFVGVLSDDTFANLPHLRFFMMGASSLTGTLPATLFESSDLILVDILSNFLTGSVPSNLYLSSTRVLRVIDNFLTGSVAALPPNIVDFDLSLNMLTGSLPLPYCLGYTVYWNYFMGSLPAFSDVEISSIDISFNLLEGSLGSFPVGLYQFSGENNFLTSTLPDLPNGTYLLYLSDNHFTGTLPIYAPLSRIDVAYNNFTGTLPPFFESLTELIANNNKFTGPIPRIGSDKWWYDVHDNMLTGMIPDFSNSEALGMFDVSNNPGISGTIPDIVCSADHLPELRVFKALGCSVACYHPCAPTPTYFDFMAPYTLQFPDDIPNYLVCNNNEREALCELDSILSISSGMPSSDTREYVAEIVEYVIKPHFTSARSLDTLEFEIRDQTTTFSRFEVIFDPHSINDLFANGVGVWYFKMTCLKDGIAYWFTKLPGTGTESSFSLSCPTVHMMLVLFTGQVINSPRAFFTVKRYSFAREWDCSDSEFAFNPCEWYGKCCCSPSYSL